MPNKENNPAETVDKEDSKLEAAKKVAKAAKASGSKKKKAAGGGALARAGKAIPKFFKDFRSEVKKIVWPDTRSVVKNTGIVLLIVAIIGVVVFGIDTGLSELLKLMMKAAKGSEETTTAAAAAIFSRFGEL